VGSQCERMKWLSVVIVVTGCATLSSTAPPPEALQPIAEVRATMKQATNGVEPPQVLVQEIPGAGMYEIRNGVPVIYIHPWVLRNPLALRIVLAHEFSHWGHGHDERCRGRVHECEHEANVSAVWVIQQTWPGLDGVYLLCTWIKGTAQGAQANSMGHNSQWEYEQFRAQFQLEENCRLR